jgi:hypothetical protein
MNNKDIILKLVSYLKKRKYSVNKIVFILGAVLLFLYVKDYFSKKIRGILHFITMPFSCVYRYIVNFLKNNKIRIVKIEAVAAVLLLLMYVTINTDFKVWISNDSGVYASEPEKETKAALPIKEDESKRYNSLRPVSEMKNPYYIKINRALNCITIYTLDEEGDYTVPIKAMRCATGGEETPLGVFSLSDKFEFAELLYNSYGQYCTRIDGPILFHSSTYTSHKKDSLSGEDYNLLGEGVSHGCVRLTTEDAKWIFDNCSKGTVTEIYEDYTSPGPLGKPRTIKVPRDTLWDPTDPDPANPWKYLKPEITGVSSRVYNEDEEVDLLEGVIAKDTCGNIITDRIIIEGNVDTHIPGIYEVVYKVTDDLNRSDIEKITITIK